MNSFKGIWILSILLVLSHMSLSSPVEKKPTNSTDEHGSDASSVESSTKEKPVTKELITSSSDVVALKVEHKAADLDENLGTSNTIPIGFTSYDAPLLSGAYAGLGQSGQYAGAGFAGNQGGHGPELILAGGHGQDQAQVLGGGYGQGQVLSAHGHQSLQSHPQELGGAYGQGQLLEGHGHQVQPVHGGGNLGPEAGYHGVVYAGHGHGHGVVPTHVQKQHITVNKQTEVGLGPHGEIQRGDTIHKTVNTVEGAGPIIGGGVPYSPYGHGGVVYMGNGLISEQEAGVHTMGPVLPPPGYHQQHHQQVAVNKQTGVGPYGETVVQTDVTVKKQTLNSVAPIGAYHGHHHGEQQHHAVPIHHGEQQHHAVPIHHGAQPHHGAQQHHGAQSQLYHPQGFAQGHGQGGYQDHGIGKQPHAQVGLDPYYGHGISVQRAVGGLGRPNPGLGYNGHQNHGIAHQDQAILGQGGRGFQQQGYAGAGRFNGLGGYSVPDPYYNNLFDPNYRRGYHQANLLTTGPNRYYQGKNPIGIYQNHRLG